VILRRGQSPHEVAQVNPGVNIAPASIQSILEHHLDQQPLEQELPFSSPNHENVRGKDYYNPPPQCPE
jgi:hypothetical protein